MFSTPSQPPRRPRPPGARRPIGHSRLSTAGATTATTDSLPTKSTTLTTSTNTSATSARPTPLKTLTRTPSSAAAKRKGKAKALTPVASTAGVKVPTPVPTPPPVTAPADTSVQDASFTSSPGLSRGRPLSMMSETSLQATSPPPPYRHVPGSAFLPEHCEEKPELPMLPMFPPPPPEPLESGPSSVRTSYVEDKYDHDDTTTNDEGIPGNTFTLKELRRLLQDREREEAMAQEVSARLVPYESVHTNAPTGVDMNANPSPTSTLASPLGIRFTPFQSRSVPSDPSVEFSLSRPRWRATSAASRDYGRHLAYLQAQEEEERLATLEDALAEARDSEEAQRKANARLRRDNCKLRRQLEHAEDAVAEHLEQEALRSSTSSTSSSPYTSLRRQMSVSGHNDEERMGWGTNTFPEFPRDPDWRINLKVPDLAFDAQSEATSEATQRPSRELSPIHPAETVMGDQLLPIVLSDSDSLKSPTALDSSSSTSIASDHPTVILPSDRGRSRPTVSSETFVSPRKSGAGGSGPVTPRLTIDVGSNPGSPRSSSRGSRTSRQSPYPSPHPSPMQPHHPLPTHKRSDSAGSNSGGSTTGPHRRAPSFGSSKSLRMILNSATKEVTTPQQSTPASAAAHASPVASLQARMDSVRSYVSDYLGRRTLGSELGSNYSPSPLGFSSPNKHNHCACPVDKDCSCEEVDTVAFEFSNLSAVHDMKFRRRPSPLSTEANDCREMTPTATFVLRGSLSRASAANAYEAFYEANVKHIRWAPASEPKKLATHWSPQSLPSPSPSPRVAVLPLGDDSDESLPFGDSSQGSIGAAMVAFTGSTPVSRIQGPMANSPAQAPNLLAPASDPWDEYSDRATPSPRTRVLRPLLLCSKPAVSARNNSLAYIHRRSASAASGVPSVRSRFASGNGVPHPAVMTHRRNSSLTTANPHLPRVPAGPVTIPGRIMHDVFCLILVILDYIEWTIILVYRVLVDIRAGPDAAITRRRKHAQRYYL